MPWHLRRLVVWTVDCGLDAVTVDCGLWAVDCGLWTVLIDCDRRSVAVSLCRCVAVSLCRCVAVSL